jgi:glycosyltransferase involved in cell wall biosynthesis
VVCCPLTVGSGTRIKLIEAAAYGRPMVSTRIGAEGLDFVPEKEILLRDDDAGFAKGCLHLLDDDGLCHRLASAARARADLLYNMGRIEERIGRLMREAVADNDDGGVALD